MKDDRGSPVGVGVLTVLTVLLVLLALVAAGFVVHQIYVRRPDLYLCPG